MVLYCFPRSKATRYVRSEFSNHECDAVLCYTVRTDEDILRFTIPARIAHLTLHKPKINLVIVSSPTQDQNASPSRTQN
jgi:hypothetical protein